MTPALRKKFIAWVQQENSTPQALELLELLLLFMKKFGKQLSQTPIKEFVQKSYPEVYALYELLGGVRLNTKDCLVIKQHLYESLGEDALVAITADERSLKDLSVQGELVIVDGWDITNPSLTITSPSKIYKRSLSADLQKLL